MEFLGGRTAQKTRQESRKLDVYSKQWLPGDTMRIYFPVFQHDGMWDIAVGAIWGHKVNDFKEIGLKTTFIPSLTEIDQETGTPIGPPDVTYQFSQIAGIFVAGMKDIEYNKLQSKNWPNESARQEALRKHEHDYDTKNNMQAHKPAIARLSYFVTTEVLCLKFVNGVPDPKSAAVVSFPLSDERLTKLNTILDDPKYQPSEGDKFLEIEWKYPSNPDKGQSAKGSAPAGLTAEYRMAVMHPDQYKQIADKFDMISMDYTTITRRATRKVSEAKIKNALMQYTFAHSEYLDACPADDEETLLKHASLIHELDCERALKNTELVDKLKAELAAMPVQPADHLPDLGQAAAAQVQTEASAAASPAMPDLTAGTAMPDLTAGTAMPDLTAGTTMPDLSAGIAAAEAAAGVTGAPSLGDLMAGPNMAQMSEDELNNISLDIM